MRIPALRLIDARTLYLISILLVFPALLINLGLLAFIDDEGIRALVALEMKLSGNFITPTLLGEFYYNKPPLYNWLLLLFFELTGRIDEWTARLPTVIFLLAYAATVFYFFKRHFSVKIAFLTAFSVVTCGRILFYDSMLGLIDICFSWIVFSLFMVLYHQYKKGNYYQLFVWTYLLTAAGFLMKGLPALVFQGFSLLAFFIYYRDIKKLFSAAHMAGIGLFVVVVGGYYMLYFEHNTFEEVFSRLFSESAKRTVVSYGWKKTVIHLFTFPFEMIYHFLPWSVLVILFFAKESVQLLFKNDFLAFCALMFLVNIPVYWSSVEVYPRYLLMFLPLFFGALFYLHQHYSGAWLLIIIETILLIFCIVVTLLSFTPLFLERTQGVPFLYWKSLSVGLILAVVTGAYLRNRDQRLLYLVVFLLVARIGFDWFVLPDRNKNDYGDLVRRSAKDLGSTTKDKSLFIFDDSFVEPASGFYITNERRKILERKSENFHPGDILIADPGKAKDTTWLRIGDIKNRHGEPKYRDILEIR